jgi:hypothetical protein
MGDLAHGERTSDPQGYASQPRFITSFVLKTKKIQRCDSPYLIGAISPVARELPTLPSLRVGIASQRTFYFFKFKNKREPQPCDSIHLVGISSLRLVNFRPPRDTLANRALLLL